MLCAVTWFAAAPAHAQEPKIGIVVSTFVNLTDQEADDLAAVLGRVLQEKMVVTTRAGPDVRAQLGEIPDDCTERSACLQELGTKLGVDQLLMLVVVRVGEKRQVSIIWADVTSGNTETRAAVTITSGQSLDKAFAGAASMLLPDTIEKREPVIEDANNSGGGDTQTDVGPPGGSTTGTVISNGPVDSGGGRRIHLATWILGGATAATMLTAAGFTARSALLFKDEETSADDQRRNNHIADGLWIATAVLGIGTVVSYFVLGDSGPSESRMGVAPTEGGGMVTFGGRF